MYLYLCGRVVFDTSYADYRDPCGTFRIEQNRCLYTNIHKVEDEGT